VIDSQIIFAIIALNACVLAAVLFGTFIFNETVRRSRNGLPTREPPPDIAAESLPMLDRRGSWRQSG
jgi:hypothetical protein